MRGYITGGIAGCLLLFGSTGSWAAPVFDGGSSARGASVSSLTYSHTVTSNTNGAIYVCAQGVQTGNPGAVSSVTYAGSALTRIQTQICYASSTNCLEVWRLKAPATGANNIVITYAGTVSEIIGTSVSYTGVDQTTPEGTVATASDTTGTSNGPITVNVSSATGGVVIDCASPRFALSAPTVGAGQTARAVKDDTASSGSWVGTSEEAGAATVTMSWALTTTPREWGTIGVPINAASGGGGGSAMSRRGGGQ